MLLGIVNDGLNCTFMICPLFCTCYSLFNKLLGQHDGLAEGSRQMLTMVWSQKSQAKFKSCSNVSQLSVSSLTETSKKRVKGGEEPHKAMLFRYTIKIIHLNSREVLRWVHSLGSFLFKGIQCAQLLCVPILCVSISITHIRQYIS